MKKTPDNSSLNLSKKDFETNNEVRWCPGCGDYSILATVQKTLPQLGIPKENIVFVSGIGCSSRFPYYLNTYGFHTIHGRAPAIATGVKLANPNLSVWMITGDGDALSIGGNHFVHLLRRNIDINILLFNNQIYGLTKGQYSPTSEQMKVTKSTPLGSPDFPLNPLLLALGSQATFIARALDVDAPLLSSILLEAARHQGSSLIEIYQNCVIFNDGAFDYLEDRKVRSENQLIVQHGKPLVFGKEQNKGLRLTNGVPEVVTFTPGSEDSAIEAGVLIFNRHDPFMATMLARIHHPEFPVPMGIIYQEDRKTFEQILNEQQTKATKGQTAGQKELQEVLASGTTWTVKK